MAEFFFIMIICQCSGHKVIITKYICHFNRSISSLQGSKKAEKIKGKGSNSFAWGTKLPFMGPTYKHLPTIFKW